MAPVNIHKSGLDGALINVLYTKTASVSVDLDLDDDGNYKYNTQKTTPSRRRRRRVVGEDGAAVM